MTRYQFVTVTDAITTTLSTRAKSLEEAVWDFLNRDGDDHRERLAPRYWVHPYFWEHPEPHYLAQIESVIWDDDGEFEATVWAIVERAGE